jgi:hypothetical protein
MFYNTSINLLLYASVSCATTVTCNLMYVHIVNNRIGCVCVCVCVYVCKVCVCVCARARARACVYVVYARVRAPVRVASSRVQINARNSFVQGC